MIGFVNHQQAEVKETEETVFYNSAMADRIMQLRAQELVNTTVREYLNPSAYPFVQGDARDKWLTERLRKIRERYILPLK